MIVCVPCRREMQCIETGRGVRYPGDHAYPGDMFECQWCGAVVIRTNESGVYDPEHVIKTIDMPAI